MAAIRKRAMLFSMITTFTYIVIFKKARESRSNSEKETENKINKLILPEQSLSQALLSFPWEELEEEILSNTASLKNRNFLIGKLISELTTIAVTPPLLEINTACEFWPNPERLSIKKVKKLHPSCVPRSSISRPVRIGVLIILGFDADSLEIHMRESGDLVDYFFLTESTRTHAHGITKPLVWEKLKEQERFAPFLDKVVHFVADDADVAFAKTAVDNSSTTDINWSVEKTQEILLWTKFLRWNKATQFFEGDDLLSFGHADEVASRKVIEILKTCEVTKDPIDVGIWFPFGNIRRSFASDFPVKGHKYTLGSPTFWRLQTATAEWKKGHVPRQKRGKSTAAPLLGGMHLSAYSYLPADILHSITATEGGISNLPRLKWIKGTYVPATKSIEQIQEEVRVLPKHIAKRVVPSNPVSYQKAVLGQLDSNIPNILPWFLECNLQRYAEWEGKSDPRVQ